MKKTALYNQHINLGAKMVDFGAVKNVITPKNLSQVFEANFNLFYDDKKNIKFISYLS